MTETITAANDYADIGINKVIRVCCRGNANITVRSVPSVPTPTTTTPAIVTQPAIITSANLVIDRISGN